MSEEGVRLDKWLWAARFYKTRRLATDAINGGKVEINGHRAKPARLVRTGDEIRLRKDALDYQLIVEGLADRRGPASVAQTLYRETEESRDQRERVRAQLRAQAVAFPQPDRRPGKHDRRQLAGFKRGD
ncbi:MAG: RNA-binding protein [Ectothiorhodospiraceae bacterium]|nr:RNA-binding protein [Ectothiorhodospiraceae bacterium]MCH8503899.1 RNA-binding protein [Ectothiorhodospiraceae bacterium]